MMKIMKKIFLSVGERGNLRVRVWVVFVRSWMFLFWRIGINCMFVIFVENVIRID